MNAQHHGGCDCGHVRYRLTAQPITVNCCHCRDCQRQTGSAFAINALIESGHVESCGAEPEAWPVETPSGMGQTILRCPKCKVAVWSIYGGAGDGARFVKVGTLDDPAALPPMVHIFTASKLPWIILPDGVPQFPGFYAGTDLKALFSAESAARWKAMLER